MCTETTLEYYCRCQITKYRVCAHYIAHTYEQKDNAPCPNYAFFVQNTGKLCKPDLKPGFPDCIGQAKVVYFFETYGEELCQWMERTGREYQTEKERKEEERIRREQAASAGVGVESDEVDNDTRGCGTEERQVKKIKSEKESKEGVKEAEINENVVSSFHFEGFREKDTVKVKKEPEEDILIKEEDGGEVVVKDTGGDAEMEDMAIDISGYHISEMEVEAEVEDVKK